MRSVSLVLGMEVTRDRENGTLSICQEYFIKSVLQRFGMGGCIPVSTPGFGAELSTEKPEKTLPNKEETQRYQAITGSVIYLIQITRYDTMYSVRQLARTMSKPSKIRQGRSKAPSAVPRWDHGLQNRVQERGLQAHRVFGRKPGQQSG